MCVNLGKKAIKETQRGLQARENFTLIARENTQKTTKLCQSTFKLDTHLHNSIEDNQSVDNKK